MKNLHFKVITTQSFDWGIQIERKKGDYLLAFAYY